MSMAPHPPLPTDGHRMPRGHECDNSCTTWHYTGDDVEAAKGNMLAVQMLAQARYEMCHVEPFRIFVSPAAFRAMVDKGLIDAAGQIVVPKNLAVLSTDAWQDQPGMEHLRDDAPYRSCSRCERKSETAMEREVCGMRQPDGSMCLGVFLS